MKQRNDFSRRVRQLLLEERRPSMLWSGCTVYILAAMSISEALRNEDNVSLRYSRYTIKSEFAGHQLELTS